MHGVIRGKLGNDLADGLAGDEQPLGVAPARDGGDVGREEPSAVDLDGAAHLVEREVPLVLRAQQAVDVFETGLGDAFLGGNEGDRCIGTVAGGGWRPLRRGLVPLVLEFGGEIVAHRRNSQKIVAAVIVVGRKLAHFRSVTIGSFFDDRADQPCHRPRPPSPRALFSARPMRIQSS